MRISEEMWKKIKTMRQEILDLKQTKKASCASKYFYYNEPTTYYQIYKITYKTGTQPIIAEVLSYAQTSLTVPSSNIQYLFIFSQVVTSFTILSTREIDKVEGVV